MWIRKLLCTKVCTCLKVYTTYIYICGCKHAYIHKYVRTCNKLSVYLSMSTYLPTYLSVFLSLISLSLYYHEEAAHNMSPQDPTCDPFLIAYQRRKKGKHP